MAMDDGMSKRDRNYDGKLDAEDILENIMFRRNWTAILRDNLADRLVGIRNGTHLAKGKKKGRPKGS